MNKVIVYKQAGGTAVILFPAPEALEIFGIDAVAQKDVPEGFPYGIIDGADVPDVEAWEVPAELLKDGIGAAWNTFDKRVDATLSNAAGGA